MSWFTNAVDGVKLLLKLKDLEEEVKKLSEKIQELQIENKNKTDRINSLSSDINSLREKLDVQKSEATDLSLEVNKLSLESKMQQADIIDDLDKSKVTFELLKEKLEKLNGKVEHSQGLLEMWKQNLLKDIEILLLRTQFSQKETPHLLPAAIKEEEK